MDPILNPILQSTYTKPQLIRRIRVLQEFLNYKFFDHSGDKAAADIKIYIEGFLALHKEDLLKDDAFIRESSWLESLDKAFWDKFNSSNISSIFKDIDQFLKTLKPVTVYVPVEFPDSQQASIGQWLKQKIRPELIYELNYDPNLIGGCALSVGGIYKDYSLRGRINDNKQAILESLRDFKK